MTTDLSTISTFIEALPDGAYRVDPATTSVTFTTRHLFGLGRVRGSIRVLAGTVTLERATTPGAPGQVAVDLDPTTFVTGNARRDHDVTGPRFLDIASHPTMVFTGILDPSRTTVEGRLTIRGRSKPVTLTVTHAAEDGGGLRVTATAVLDRYSWGLTRAKGMAARRLGVTVVATLIGP